MSYETPYGEPCDGNGRLFSSYEPTDPAPEYWLDPARWTVGGWVTYSSRHWKIASVKLNAAGKVDHVCLEHKNLPGDDLPPWQHIMLPHHFRASLGDRIWRPEEWPRKETGD